MQKIVSKLTVFYEEPFWVGIYERMDDNKLEVCKITFGTEPKDYEVHSFLLQNWSKLHFSPPVAAEYRQRARISPKRMQRFIKRSLETQGTGTKSQQALKLQHEAEKIARKERTRQQKEEEKLRKFRLHQQKRKEKHKGR